jgi:hypothetical protein
VGSYLVACRAPSLAGPPVEPIAKPAILLAGLCLWRDELMSFAERGEPPQDDRQLHQNSRTSDFLRRLYLVGHGPDSAVIRKRRIHDLTS